MDAPVRSRVTSQSGPLGRNQTPKRSGPPMVSVKQKLGLCLRGSKGHQELELLLGHVSQQVWTACWEGRTRAHSEAPRDLGRFQPRSPTGGADEGLDRRRRQRGQPMPELDDGKEQQGVAPTWPRQSATTASTSQCSSLDDGEGVVLGWALKRPRSLRLEMM